MFITFYNNYIKSWLLLKLVAREEKAQPYTTQCIVHLTIIDRNDNFPQFTKSSFAVHIVENYTNEQLVLSEKVSDFKLYEQ